jgi:hypothetical protein
MNIKSAAALRFLDPTKLAAIPVSLASLPLLAFPVASIVKGFPSGPRGVIRARPMCGFPRAEAGGIAERHSISPRPAGSRYVLATLIAVGAFALNPSRRKFAYAAAPVGRRHTFSGAIVVCASSLISSTTGRRPVELRLAMTALKRLPFPTLAAGRGGYKSFTDCFITRPRIGAAIFNVLIRHSLYFTINSVAVGD